MNKSKTPLTKILKDFSPLKKYFFENRFALLLGFICLLSVDFLQLIVPLVIKRAIDALTIKTATATILLNYAVIILIIALMTAILRFFWRLLVIGHSRKVEEKLRNRLFKHLETLSLSFYQRTKTGDIMARSINDIMAVRMAVGMGLVAFIDSLILGLAAICFMVYINPYLTLLSILPAPFVILLARRLTRRMASGHENVQKKFSDLTERVREAFSGIRVIKSFSRENWELEKVGDEGKLYISANMKLTRLVAFFFPMMALFTNLGLAIVLWYGGRLTILDRITTGDFVAFIGYLNLLTWPIMAIGWVTNLFQRGAASMRRINRVLEEKPDITGPALSKGIPAPEGEIKFKGIYFVYPGKTQKALKNISMTIKQGDTVSLVGRVASGKTTLLYTIPRMLEIQQGSILIDGRDIRSYPLQTLRKSIGFVTQDSIIFSDTIRNNVLFGRRDITEDALLNALKAAGIYDEILNLDEGLDTLLGERGVTLSGGERQRLTIARAIVADPPILIMDDSMSMIDTRTEEAILNAILSYRRDKTNLIVSHRLSTISRADFIAVMDNGELVETGDHESLLMKGDEFKRLYERQILARELEINER
jgi:ATP-binding cassette subfamily B protein